MTPQIILFVMKGCGACHEYEPRFRRLAELSGIYYRIIDITAGPRQAVIAEDFGVNATPTTVVLRSGNRSFKKVGAISDVDIKKLLHKARQ